VTIGSLPPVWHPGVKKLLERVPNSVFEANVPGVRTYSLPARVSCLGVKFFEYSLAGMVCGFVGQGIANTFMAVKCALPPPPLSSPTKLHVVHV
jgi:Protein RETICULATA-related